MTEFEYNSIKETTKYNEGPTVNCEWTFDDSVSRRRAIQVFRKEFGIELQEYPGEYTKVNNEYILVTPGQYCVDLYAFVKDIKSFIFVEVERTKNERWFNPNNLDPINILNSKYQKYFRHDCAAKRYYMCFINEELEKAIVISGADIKAHRGKYKEIKSSNGKIHEVYEINKKFAKIYDLDHNVNAIIDSCLITY